MHHINASDLSTPSSGVTTVAGDRDKGMPEAEGGYQAQETWSIPVSSQKALDWEL